jgi:hypothetical protein
MSFQIIPLAQNPNQTFSVQLTVDGAPLTLNFFLSYITMSGWWQLQVSSAQNAVLIASLPLLTGFYPGANMLAQHGYLKIGSAYMLNTGNATTDYPAANNLSTFSLLWGDTAP